MNSTKVIKICGRFLLAKCSNHLYGFSSNALPRKTRTGLPGQMSAEHFEGGALVELIGVCVWVDRSKFQPSFHA